MYSWVCGPECGSCDIVVNAAARRNSSADTTLNRVSGMPPNFGVAMARMGAEAQK